jgi:acetyltransferase
VSLASFFAPRSVALVGATEEVQRFGGRALANLVRFGFAGRIFPIHHRLERVQGIPAYRDIAALPETPDHVGVVVPAAAAMDTVRACVARGVPFVTVFTGGFAELLNPEGAALQAELARLVRGSATRLMGPNCNGVIDFHSGFALASTGTIAGGRARAGDVAIVGNSGGLAQVNTMWRAQEAGLAISHEVSCGNEADLTIADFVDALIDDARVRVVLVLAERIRDGERFAAVARRAARARKPIVLLKLGASEAGRNAVALHTGPADEQSPLDDRALDALGVIRVDDPRELYEAAMLLRDPRRPAGLRAASVSVSGGNNVLLADRAAERGIGFVDLDETTHRRIAELVPGYIRVGNPADMTSAAIGKPDTYAAILRAIADDPRVDMILPLVTLLSAAEVRAGASAVSDGVKPGALIWTGGCTDDPNFTARDLVATGVPVYRDIVAALNAVAATMRYADFLRRTQPPSS